VLKVRKGVIVAVVHAPNCAPGPGRRTLF
jgi:hypothetical protein